MAVSPIGRWDERRFGLAVVKFAHQQSIRSGRRALEAVPKLSGLTLGRVTESSDACDPPIAVCPRRGDAVRLGRRRWPRGVEGSVDGERDRPGTASREGRPSRARPRRDPPSGGLGAAREAGTYNQPHGDDRGPRRARAQHGWREELYERQPERQGELFSTISGVENEPLATPDTVDVDYERDLGYPGAYPFTRGVYPSMYRGTPLDDAPVRRLRHARRRRTSASATCSSTARPGSRPPSTCRR